MLLDFREKTPLPPEAQALFNKGKGRVAIASSQADEKSLAGRPYSAFTLALTETHCSKTRESPKGLPAFFRSPFPVPCCLSWVNHFGFIMQGCEDYPHLRIRLLVFLIQNPKSKIPLVSLAGW